MLRPIVKARNNTTFNQICLFSNEGALVPHPRTLRKARENIKWMVIDGVSLQKTRNYLHRFVLWWQRTAEDWQYDELLNWLIASCWERTPAAIAASLLHSPPTLLRNPSPSDVDSLAAA